MRWVVRFGAVWLIDHIVEPRAAGSSFTEIVGGRWRCVVRSSFGVGKCSFVVLRSFILCIVVMRSLIVEGFCIVGRSFIFVGKTCNVKDVVVIVVGDVAVVVGNVVECVVGYIWERSLSLRNRWFRGVMKRVVNGG
jgi:hypothetical protein